MRFSIVKRFFPVTFEEFMECIRALQSTVLMLPSYKQIVDCYDSIPEALSVADDKLQAFVEHENAQHRTGVPVDSFTKQMFIEARYVEYTLQDDVGTLAWISTKGYLPRHILVYGTVQRLEVCKHILFKRVLNQKPFGWLRYGCGDGFEENISVSIG